MKSKFTFFSIFLITGLTIVLVILFVSEASNSGLGVSSFEAGIFVNTMLIFALLLVIRDMRKRLVQVNFGDDELSIRNYFGLGRLRRFRYDEIDGFQTSKLDSKNYLYILKGSNKIAVISEFHHSNYSILLAEAQDKLIDLGFIRTNMITEIKDIFKK